MANEHVPGSKPIPRRLHKYRGFNTHTLRLLTDAEVYYANPRQFNDPLDSAPTIIVDVDLNSLERLCYRMLLETRTKDEAKRVIQELHHYSTEYGDYRTDLETEDYLKRLVADQVKSIVDLEMATNGIFSLDEKWDCPLMWSHYADEHRGICIGYDIVAAEHKEMAAVNYRCPRGIRASDVLAWKTNGSAAAEKRVRDTYFFAKSPQWRYEREWRDIASSTGTLDQGFSISAIYFGLRCDQAVETSVVKLIGKVKGLSLYNIYVNDDSFRLKRRTVNVDEILALGVRSSVSLYFRDVVLPGEG